MFDGHIRQNGGPFSLMDLMDALPRDQVHKICDGAPASPPAAQPSSPLAIQRPSPPALQPSSPLALLRPTRGPLS